MAGKQRRIYETADRNYDRDPPGGRHAGYRANRRLVRGMRGASATAGSQYRGPADGDRFTRGAPASGSGGLARRRDTGRPVTDMHEISCGMSPFTESTMSEIGDTRWHPENQFGTRLHYSRCSLWPA